nr:hypothetical protein [Pseudofrankia sp. DC12]
MLGDVPQPAVERQAGQEERENCGPDVHRDEPDVVRAAPRVSVCFRPAGVAFLGVEQAVVLDPDVERAREVSTAHVGAYVSMASHHAANMRRMGFDEGDLGRPSRRLVDAMVAYGDAPVIRDRVRQHLDARRRKSREIPMSRSWHI